jgi:hypothetical protein
VPDIQHTFPEIYILTIQPHGLSDPHARDGEQAEQCGICQRSKPCFGGKLLGSVDERQDLLLSVDIGLLSQVFVREQALWWDFRSVVCGAIVRGELPNDTEPLCPVCLMAIPW